MHEAGAGLAVGAVLDPHPAAVQAHVLVDEGEAEPGAVAASCAVRRPPRAKRSKTSARSSTGTPGPWSSTAIHDLGQRLVVGFGDG